MELKERVPAITIRHPQFYSTRPEDLVDSPSECSLPRFIRLDFWRYYSFDEESKSPVGALKRSKGSEEILGRPISRVPNNVSLDLRSQREVSEQSVQRANFQHPEPIKKVLKTSPVEEQFFGVYVTGEVTSVFLEDNHGRVVAPKGFLEFVARRGSDWKAREESSRDSFEFRVGNTLKCGQHSLALTPFVRRRGQTEGSADARQVNMPI